MRILYDFFFLAFSLLYIPGLLIKGKLRKNFTEKLGRVPRSVTRFKRPVWIHAVSVGEAAVAARLAAGIKSGHPDIPVVVSTTTLTGNDMIKKAGKGSVDAVFYYPLDLSCIVSSVVRKIDPRLYVMIETELWPNMLRTLKSHKVPVVLANGRISDASFRNYRRIKFITGKMLSCVSAACVQTERDAEKIKYLGKHADNVFVCGNMKFDATLRDLKTPLFTKEQMGFGADDMVIIAGSTHFPEESMIMDAFVELRKNFRELRLVIVPRHIERKDAIRIYAEKLALKSIFFSDIMSSSENAGLKPDVIIVDTIGHLKDLYGIATLVFIGGSMVKKGGQNPIEAALWKKAVVFGPNMSNFREISKIFMENDAAMKVRDASELEAVFKDLLANISKRERMAANAGRVIKENTGAVQKTVAILDKYLKGTESGGTR
jgi:3-deoxy-D-manno-octulosonic-acid transferase